ncbi:protein-L-isoaspartate O-methyltransferase [bacterium]|nr:protein-L-isoaspartate O-methyltransferase [bacterium]
MGADQNKQLVEKLIKSGYLKTPKIIEAFLKIKREDFLPQDLKHLAALNEALPIGYGQTISQPLVVAFMLEKLEPKEGEKILDIGSGSGWTTALLAYLVSQEGNSKPQTLNSKQYQNLNVQNSKQKNLQGKVIALEIIPELKEFGERNVAKYNFIEKGIVKFICADGTEGYPEEAPYDKILCSASAKALSEAWKKQLKIGGKIVTPIGTSIWVFEKIKEDDFVSQEFPGFVFVPLIEK